MNINMKFYGHIISYFLKFSLFALFFWSIHKREYIWALGCLLSLIVCFLPTLLKRRWKIHLPIELELLIVLALFLHSGGGALDAYHNIPWWDHITHFLSTAVVSLLAFIVMAIIDAYSSEIKFNMPLLIFFIVIFSLAMGVIWEFFEFTSDLLFGTHAQLNNTDTMVDLFFDLLGGIIVAIPGALYLKHTTPERFGLEMGEEIGLHSKN